MYLLRETRTYRADQVSSPQKIQLLWQNLKEALGVTEHPTFPDVTIEVQPGLFDDGSVAVTFGAWVVKDKRGKK